MVQLKDYVKLHICVKIAQFQFQNGSIKSLYLLISVLIEDLFQFQNGSIKSYGSNTATATYW